MLFTCGMSIFLQALFNMIFGAPAQCVKIPVTAVCSMWAVSWSLFQRPSPSLLQLLFVWDFICLLCTLRWGDLCRATSQDRSTAQLMGINANFVYCLCFAISLAVVGIAAALLTPFYSVTPYVGAAFCFKSFIIVALGGKGNIPGAMVAGIIIGIIEKVGAVLWGASIAQVIIFIMFIVILLVLPNGIMGIKLPQKRKAVN